MNSLGFQIPLINWEHKKWVEENIKGDKMIDKR